MAITWRGSESEREAVALRALVRRLREFMDGRAHTYTDGVIIEGHIGERQGSVQLLSLDGQNQLLVSLACGRSPALQILPIGTNRTPGLEAYTEPEHSASRMHSIWTDDITATAGLLSNEDNLRAIREFCLHRGSSLRIGGGTIEFHGPVPSNADYFEYVRTIVLKLAGIATAFEREKVRLPRSHGRDILKVAVALLCIVVFSAMMAPSVRTMFSSKKEEVKIVHFDPKPLLPWRGVTADDFQPDDLEWFTDRHQAPQAITYIDFDGTKQESGTVQFLRQTSEDQNAPFRVLCYDHGKVVSDDVYPNVAFVLKFNATELRKVKWNGSIPARLPPGGEALLLVQSRKEPGSGTVYLLGPDGKMSKFQPVDYRFL